MRSPHTQYSLTLPLPTTFRLSDILAFHRRDSQEIAEKVGNNTLEKGIIWGNTSACLSISFTAKQANVDLLIDGPEITTGNDQQTLESTVRRMLGLDQNIEAFETHHRHHPQLSRLIAQQTGLRVPVTATPFEALSWAITGQQISVNAAVSLRRKLILAVNVRHSSGLFCYPQAQQMMGLSEECLRQNGFSTTKAKALLTIAGQITNGQLPLDAWTQTSINANTIYEQLINIRGVGPWTANYTLLRGFGWLDGSLHGDIAVRRGLQTLLGVADKIDEEEAKRWLAQFSPWRALVGAHLWAAQSTVA